MKTDVQIAQEAIMDLLVKLLNILKFQKMNLNYTENIKLKFFKLLEYNSPTKRKW